MLLILMCIQHLRDIIIHYKQCRGVHVIFQRGFPHAEEVCMAHAMLTEEA